MYINLCCINVYSFILYSCIVIYIVFMYIHLYCIYVYSFILYLCIHFSARRSHSYCYSTKKTIKLYCMNKNECIEYDLFTQ